MDPFISYQKPSKPVKTCQKVVKECIGMQKELFDFKCS